MPPPTLTSASRWPASSQPTGQGDDRRQGRLERREPIGQPAGPGMEVERVDGQIVSPHGRQRVIEPIGRDAQLGGTRSGVGEPVVVAGTDHRVDAQADRRARRPAPDPLDLADGIEVDVHAGTEDDVEVALRAVRPGVGDLGAAQPLASASSTSPGEQASMPTDPGSPARPSPRRAASTSGSRLALRAKRRRWSRPARAGGRVHGSRVLADALEVIDEARRASRAGQRLGVLGRR